MGHEKQIIDAFRTNKIERILLIDDAYDPPLLNDDYIGDFLDFMDSTDGHAACNESGIEENTIEAAIEAASGNQIDSDELKSVIDALYTSFRRNNGDQKFDPGGHFKLLKSLGLEDLRPLFSLLSKCGEVYTAGLENGMACHSKFDPQIIFLDYYLDANVSIDDTNKDNMTRGRDRSLDLLRDVVKPKKGESIPAIILMSKHDVQNDVDEYRHDAESEILSLRFGFLQKNMVRQEGQEIEVEHTAADALLDVSQGYLFGKALQSALAQWKYGAESALELFMKEIGNLQTKDFAYLLRFRLREDGQPLNEYLEWLFGECLKGLINEKVDWENPSFSELEDNEKIEENIEGAFEGPSMMIAKLFHRSRVDSHRISAHRRYRLGDLYAQSDMHNIRVVITPDCDLVERGDQRTPEIILTIGGTLHTFDNEKSAADDFLLYKNKAYSVLWNPKDLRTFPFKGQESLHKSYKFVGTLRPLYAQEMQRRALTDLYRVGLPVAPALGINATATVWIRKKGSYDQVNINSSTRATIIPARAQGRGHRVLFPRPFVHELIDRLDEIQHDDMSQKDNNSRLNALKDDGVDKLYREFLKEGVPTNVKSTLGIWFILGDGPNTQQVKPWLKIVLDLSDEAAEELRTTDPLA